MSEGSPQHIPSVENEEIVDNSSSFFEKQSEFFTKMQHDQMQMIASQFEKITNVLAGKINSRLQESKKRPNQEQISDAGNISGPRKVSKIVPKTVETSNSSFTRSGDQQQVTRALLAESDDYYDKNTDISTRAEAESVYSDNEGQAQGDNSDSISIPEQADVDKDVQSLLLGLQPEIHNEMEAANTSESTSMVATVLSQIEEEMESMDNTGGEVNPKLAKIASGLFTKKLPAEKLTAKLKKHNPPANCTGLYIPKCNGDIWNTNLNSELRNSDQSLQKLTGQLIKASSAILAHTNNLVSLQEQKATDIPLGDMTASCIDVLTILGNMHQDLTQFRRDIIKPKLPGKLQRLATNVPAESKELFGDELNKRIVSLISSNKALMEKSYAHNNTSYGKYSKNVKTPRRGSASGKPGYRQSRGRRGMRR